MKNNFCLPALIALFLVFFQTGCISYYKIYQKTPCEQIGSEQEQLESIKKIILQNGIRQDRIDVNGVYVAYGKRSKFEYSNIERVIVQTKVVAKGKRYTLIIKTKSGQKFGLLTFDFDLAIKVYSTLECRAGIKPKLSTQTPPPPDKYDRLKKLKELYDIDGLTKDEYDKEKEKLLNEK